MANEKPALGTTELTAEQNKALTDRFVYTSTHHPTGAVPVRITDTAAMFVALLVAEARAAHWEACADRSEALRAVTAASHALDSATRAHVASENRLTQTFLALEVLGVGAKP